MPASAIRRTALILLALAMLLQVASGPARGEEGNWPQFRGPTGQGLAPEASPPIEWDAKRNIVWKTDLPGMGHSSPVIWNDQVWVTTATPDGRELGAIGLDRATGDILHSVTLFTPRSVVAIHAKNSYASTTPVIAPGRLYAHFGTYGAACLDTSTGEIIWKNEELEIDHQGGPGSSPVLFQDLLIVTCDGADQQYVAALDAGTGRIRWKRQRSAPFRENPITHRAFATPLLIEYAGRTQLISPAADQLHAYDPATGDELWHVRYTGFSTVPCPAYAEGTIFFCTGYFGPELAAVGVDGRGEVTRTHLRWRMSGGVPEIPSPLVHDGRVYVISDQGIGTCLDAATGKRIWRQRFSGNYSASPLLAGDHIYLCSESGLTRVLRAGDSPKIVASNRLPGAIMASPAAVGKALYLRTERSLYRIEER